MYCKLNYVGKQFKGIKIYKCDNCGLELALEDPSINILCFREAKDVLNQFRMADGDASVNDKTAFFSEQNNVQAFVSEQASKALSNQSNQTQTRQAEAMCTEEEIQNRLSICRACKYYKDDSCMLCGCVIVREKNYMNKLANKNASCPDNKWGPIN